MKHRYGALTALTAAMTWLVGCSSPEAHRVRGGGQGADPGNRDAVVEIHGGSLMYYKTPCLTPKDECSGPLPRSGLPEKFPEPRTKQN